MFLGLLLFVYLYYVLSDLLSSDVLLSMMALNIVAVILGVDLSGEMRWPMIWLSVGLGFASKIGRYFVHKVFMDENADPSGLFDGGYGLAVMLVLGLVYLVILKWMGY